MTAPTPSPLAIWQQRLSVTTWFITLALSLRGFFVFYGMKDKTSFEQILTTLTEPLVQLFTFPQIENIGIPAIGVLFAAVSFLLVTQSVQFGLWFVKYRQERSRYYAFHHAITVRSK